MSLEEIREQNKQKVILCALDCFVKDGIENTKIKEIAVLANLTERSVYRYFETKSDLVLSAALLFWDKNVRRAEEVYQHNDAQKLTGAQQIKAILLAYAELYFTDRNKLVFVQEAEAYLYKNGKSCLLRSKPPAVFSHYSAPLAKAIQKGLADGSVKENSEMECLYYNAYDSLLGLMQNMALGEREDNTSTVSARKRLQSFCTMLTAALTGN